MSYGLPQNTIVNRQVPKKSFVENLGGKKRIAERFTKDLENIVWLSKLAPSTINVDNGKAVHEISIFVVPLKNVDAPNDVFTFIDSHLPRHTLFILEYGERSCLLINYKEEIKGNSDNKYHIIETYRTQWAKKEKVEITLSGLSMDSIYETLVRQVAGKQIIIENNSLSIAVEKTKQYEELKKECESLRKKIAKEVQPTKKYELHQELTKMNKKMEKFKVRTNKNKT